ncbi:MAG: DUF4230 domain-containing protein [Bacteroidetes bacterium]|nr:DUF4230 domain-containing protein [Bacteroidota bacterium]MCW5894754.1 DUF4230 domain-containing protein [Bacteroidota bacterium]
MVILSTDNLIPKMMNSKHSKLMIAGGIGLLLAAIAAYIVFVRIPTDLATNVANGIKEAFNFTPRVQINETVVIEQNTPILEIATVARDMMVEYSWSHQWLGSTKTIALRGTFTAKAGFDLHEPFTITIRKYPLRVDADMPAPKLLSVEMNSYKIILDENGWWNRISDADRETAVQELHRIAREKAQNSGMLAEARSTIEQRIKEIVERNGAMVEFKYPWQE